MIKTIFFDFGNVLAFFDHERAIRALQPHTTLTAEEMVQFLYEDGLAYRYERGEATTDEVYTHACARGGLRCTRAEFIAGFCDIFWPNPPMSDLIPRLKRNGYRLVVASNTNAAHFERYAEQFKDLLAHFDAIVVSHEAGARKPEPQFFAYGQRFANCAATECVFVDDIAENVVAAREFGWHALQYTKFDELIPQLRVAGVRVD